MRVVTTLGFALAAVSLSTGAVSASGVERSAAQAQHQQAQHQQAAPADAAQALCERLIGTLVPAPVAGEIVPVCKLVNGWD